MQCSRDKGQYQGRKNLEGLPDFVGEVQFGLLDSRVYWLAKARPGLKVTTQTGSNVSELRVRQLAGNSGEVLCRGLPDELQYRCRREVFQSGCLGEKPANITTEPGLGHSVGAVTNLMSAPPYNQPTHGAPGHRHQAISSPSVSPAPLLNRLFIMHDGLVRKQNLLLHFHS